ncbi:hypothetical protein C2G38_2046960 [Gigaspora rosea]|uniref:Crinkler family protein n=1 Tax=Gigaspora rosea TaxID=44941 RepID=A0A397U7Q0_9GLOM|nr:hypothetical protein C2G38_2046960 [Gigaspora rosea]
MSTFTTNTLTFEAIQDWTVETVQEFLKFKQRDFSLSEDEIQTFANYSFNGPALLKTNRDILLSFVGLRLGPALNVAAFVENLNNQNLLYKNVLDVVLHLKKLDRLPDSLEDPAEVKEEDADEEDTEDILQTEIEQSTSTNTQYFIQHPDRRSLAIIDMPALYMRQSYKDLYRMIITMKNSKFLITGTSGVGKSCFLLYLMIRLLCNINDVTIIFQPIDGEVLYCLKNSGVTVGTYIDFYNLLHNHPETWYLVDGTGPMKSVQARTVVSASPKSIKSQKFQEFVKDPMIQFCVPPWSIEELLICKKIFTTVPKKLMLDLIDKVGGIPRYVLKWPAQLISDYDPDDSKSYDRIIKLCLKRIEDAIKEIDDFSKLVQCFTEDASYVKFSSRLVHKWPDTYYQEHTLRWASIYIFNKIEQKLGDSRWVNFLMKVRNPDDSSSSRGIMFESLVIHIFQVGNQQFEAKCIQGKQDGKKATLNITENNLTVKYIRNAEQLSKYNDEATIIQPIKRNFGAADFIILPDNIFQITVSKKHPIKQSELVKIVKNIKAYRINPNSTIKLWFIVPEDIYDDFQSQKYITPKNIIGGDLEAYKEVSRKSSVLNNIEQWVVKIKLTPGLV